MHIGVYNPYLSGLGGGEQYASSLAACFSPEHEVEFFWDDPGIIKRAEARFGISVPKVRCQPNYWLSDPLLAKLIKSRKLDLLFFVSDGSVPISWSTKTVLIYQFPVPAAATDSLIARWKMSRISRVVCYSNFVKNRLDKKLGIKAAVIPPGIDVRGYKAVKKQKIILSVGRFTSDINAKKQHVLIEAFKKLVDWGLKEWTLVLAGGTLPEDKSYLDELKASSRGYPIKIAINVSYDLLKQWYAQAPIYWHAAGFGEDLDLHPEKAEHFGITSVEAMASE